MEARQKIEPWQWELKSAATSVRDLKGYAYLEKFSAQELSQIEAKFRTSVPQYYLNLICKEDPLDPVAMMAFPSPQEQNQEGFRDPIGDLAKQKVNRLTHRYPDRALLHTTNLCPMYCRFCFRKNLMNERDEALYSGDFDEAFAYLSEHTEIEELILTGGDPWMLSDGRLSVLLDGIQQAAPHLKRLRFHTRMPVTLPMRVTDSLLRILEKVKPQVFVVTHFNHPNELSELALDRLQKLRSVAVVLNQSVLLKGVNDSSAVLAKLFTELGNVGVIPYYLHHCDLVEGGAHFRVNLQRGQEIWEELRGKISGYLIPEYILDRPGGLGKVPLGRSAAQKLGVGIYRVSGGLEYHDPHR